MLILGFQYYAFMKETEACPEMGEIDEVARAIKRYTKFMELQNHCLDKCVCAVCLLHVCEIVYRLHLESAACWATLCLICWCRHPDVVLVPPFDVKVVWLAHLIRVSMVRSQHPLIDPGQPTNADLMPL